MSAWSTVLAEPVPEGWDLDVIRRGNARAREAYRAMFATSTPRS